MKEIVNDLYSNKAAGGKIPLKILKECDFFFHFLTNCIDDPIKNNKFPDFLKLSNIVAVHKQKDPTVKTNYRPVSVLPLCSKVFKKVMHIQLYDYMENFLNHLLCGFCKTHSAQHARFKLIQSWQKGLDESGFVGTILMDLSKAYDCLPHDLMAAKLETYGLAKESLQLISDYLIYSKQKTQLVLHIVTGSMSLMEFLKGLYWDLFNILFNIFINYIFLVVEKSDICNLADHNTLYSCGSNLHLILISLEYDMRNLVYWFKINSLKANPGKFQFTILGKNCLKYSLKIESITVKASEEIELLEITIELKKN